MNSPTPTCQYLWELWLSDQGGTWRMLLSVQASKYTYMMTVVSILCIQLANPILWLDLGKNCHHVRFLASHTHHNFSWPLGDWEKVAVIRIYCSSLICVNKLHPSNEIWTHTTDSPCRLGCVLCSADNKGWQVVKFQHQKRATGFRWQPHLLTGSSKKQDSLGHLRTGRGCWVVEVAAKKGEGVDDDSVSQQYLGPPLPLLFPPLQSSHPISQSHPGSRVRL